MLVQPVRARKMKKEIMLTGESNTEPPDNFELGTWLGRRQAFGLMSGKSAAADIQCLRQIRDNKLYRGKAANWREFCTQYVGASKTQVDRQIRYLEEFGPQFFELGALTRISPETYRLLAGRVSAAGLLVDGEVIPLVEENSARIARAVGEFRRRAGGSEARPQPDGFEAVEKRLDEVIARLRGLPNLDARQKIALGSRLLHLWRSAASAGVALLGS